MQFNVIREDEPSQAGRCGTTSWSLPFRLEATSRRTCLSFFQSFSLEVSFQYRQGSEIGYLHRSLSSFSKF